MDTAGRGTTCTENSGGPPPPTPTHHDASNLSARGLLVGGADAVIGSFDKHSKHPLRTRLDEFGTKLGRRFGFEHTHKHYKHTHSVHKCGHHYYLGRYNVQQHSCSECKLLHTRNYRGIDGTNDAVDADNSEGNEGQGRRSWS